MTVDKQSVDGTVERGQGEVLNSGGLLGESAVGTQARRRVLVEQLTAKRDLLRESFPERDFFFDFGLTAW